MQLFNNTTGFSDKFKSELNGYPRYLAHRDEPDDPYQESADRDGNHNSRNFFDDSNSIDKYWFDIAREHLKNLGPGTIK